MPGKVAIIGAGIVGVSAAIWMHRAGLDVTLIDRSEPGSGTSHGNAGVLASCAIVPVTTPGLMLKAPGMLIDRDFPLFLRWSYLPKLAPWLRRYLSHATDTETRRIARDLTPIVGDSVEQHKSLCQDLGLGAWVQDSHYCFAYPDRAAFEADHYAWAVRKANGFEPELLTGGAVQEFEPNLGPDITCLAVMKNHGHIRDPRGYVKALAEAFVARGGHCLTAEVADITMTAGKVSAVETTQGMIACDDLVIATGVWSKPLMRKLGLRVPLESERGYHIVFKDASGGPANPTMISAGKFVATPMEQGLRCAGVVEFGGLTAGPAQAPLALLRRQAKAALPHLEAAEEVEWMGHRPAPSDSLPLIGQVGESRVYTAFGHHHIGLTGGPKTGRLIAGLIAGQGINTNLAPYDPMRFSSRTQNTKQA